MCVVVFFDVVVDLADGAVLGKQRSANFPKPLCSGLPEAGKKLGKFSFHSLPAALGPDSSVDLTTEVPRGPEELGGALSGSLRAWRRAKDHLLRGAGNCLEILPVKWELGSWGNFQLHLLLKG